MDLNFQFVYNEQLEFGVFLEINHDRSLIVLFCNISGRFQNVLLCYTLLMYIPQSFIFFYRFPYKVRLGGQYVWMWCIVNMFRPMVSYFQFNFLPVKCTWTDAVQGSRFVCGVVGKVKVKLSLCLTKSHTMNIYGVVEL
jgi:hypothetical protein